MLGLQVSIGALNDLVDAPLDAGRKPGKPIPRGAATPGDARLLAGVGLAVAIGLSLPSGPLALGVLGLGAACGYGYDLRLSRTTWSWLPLAIALPLVAVYAWLGATGVLPTSLLGLTAAGVLAGAGLAISNALADLERDRSAGVASIAVRLGRPAAAAVHSALLLAAIGVALVAGPPARPLLLAGVLVVAAGIGVGWGGGPVRRERGWELEAIGVAILGAGWIGGLVGVG